MNFFSKSISETDKIIFGSIQDELARQQNQIELIASENIVSKAVLEVQGSIFTNKYAEGYPNSRYYSGCDYVDIAEELAIERVKSYTSVIMLMFSPILAPKLMALFV